MTDAQNEKDDRTVVLYPGSNNLWDCVKCSNAYPTNSAFSKHLLTAHQIRHVSYKCGCGFISDNSRSVGTHKRYCAGFPPEEHNRLFKCQHCQFSTNFENGLSVHISRAHPSLLNDQLKEKTRNFQRTEPEFRFLAETVLDLKQRKIRDINLAASKILGRSHQAIQKIRTKTEYKRIERTVKLERNNSSVEQTPQTHIDPIITPTDVEQSPSYYKDPLTTPIDVEQPPSLPPSVEHSPQRNVSVEQTPLHNETPKTVTFSANRNTISRGSYTDNPYQTQLTSIRRPVNTPSRRLLPSIPPTPVNTQLLSASSLQIEAETSTPTVTAKRRRESNTQIEADIFTPITVTTAPTESSKRRRLPDAPVTSINYKQCSQLEISRFLTNPSTNTSKHNFLVIQYL